ncbi:DNA topology modulation protein [Emticicia sp. 17c]|uniref:DNA topology modulation protein n=1 Tax=Emticicia sp. 17c TaxID=3127704 RepID=UPI00301E42F2
MTADFQHIKRISVVGCSGAGKSTLARQLAEALALPVVHLDAELWQPGWKMVPKDKELAIVKNLISKDKWIIDGNYHSTMPIRFAATEAIILLDFSTWLCLKRVIQRFFRYKGTTRPDMREGCPEKLDWEFIIWILSFRHRQRPLVLKHINAHKNNCHVLVFRNPKQVVAFLNAIPHQ